MSGRKVFVIGGGAAGFFAAIQCARINPGTVVTILEKSSKILSKVRVSGGGRCNVTNAQTDPALLAANYPRGGRELLGPFHRFGSAETWQWFADEGVRLKAEDDGRVFPVTDDSGTIINCLLSAAETCGVTVRINAAVTELDPREEGGFSLTVNDENTFADAVIVAAGGSPQQKGFDWLKRTGHQIVPPVPSLFTFNIRDKKLTALMGVSVDSAIVRLKGSSFVTEGPVLITHWGLSGPAVLRLSSIGARYLHELDYRCEVSVGWYAGDQSEVASVLNDQKAIRPKARVTGYPVMKLPMRLWEYLCATSGIEERMTWSDLSKKNITGLSERINSDKYMISGKTTFREEFVTCGGISLREVDFKTMESKLCKGLYFAGEILDIDGITGGFNFQAAWTTGYIAGSSVG